MSKNITVTIAYHPSKTLYSLRIVNNEKNACVFDDVYGNIETAYVNLGRLIAEGYLL